MQQTGARVVGGNAPRCATPAGHGWCVYATGLGVDTPPGVVRKEQTSPWQHASSRETIISQTEWPLRRTPPRGRLSPFAFGQHRRRIPRTPPMLRATISPCLRRVKPSPTGRNCAHTDRRCERQSATRTPPAVSTFGRACANTEQRTRERRSVQSPEDFLLNGIETQCAHVE